MKKLSLLIAISVLLSSCASILNGKYQKITINTNQENTILVNGETPKIKKGKYLFKRDRIPKQITVKHKGYKDENITIMQYKLSPLYIMSWIPFGILIYPPLADFGLKAYNYDKEIEIGKKMISIPVKDEKSKEIELNKIAVNIDADNIDYGYFRSYKNFIKGNEKKDTKNKEVNENIKLENTIFAETLNDLLKEKGYIDTTRRVLKNSYLDNLYINATVTDYYIHNAFNNQKNPFATGGMIYSDLTIKWEVLDYYKKTIHSLTTKTTSGQFAIFDYSKPDKPLHSAIKDAIEYGLIEFMTSEKVNQLLHDDTHQEEEIFEEIILPNSKTHITSIAQSIKSSVTIKNKEGHGSGFVISNNGYIITNYHVISDTTDLKVILNDETEHNVEVIRYSKIHDLALLKIEINNLVPFNINKSKEIFIASEIYTVGTPTAEDLSQSISKGIISGIRKTNGNSKLIQTDASINSGNSGGAIVDKNGLVLGVVSSKLFGVGIEGVAFGIPAYEILDKLNIRL